MTDSLRFPALPEEERAALTALAERPRRLLVVVPHPDDESYGAGGTLARVGADPEIAVVLWVLTSGEAASIGPERGLRPEELARIREERLESVVDEFGLDQLLLGRLPDGGLAELPLRPFAAFLRSRVEVFRPQVVIGHDPRGVNAHPDHIAAHWALRLALGDGPVRRLAMFAHDEEAARAAAPRRLFATPAQRRHLCVELGDEEIAAKERALRIHEAVVTLDRQRADREALLWRPPVESWEFFREPSGMRCTGLFERLPESPPPF